MGNLITLTEPTVDSLMGSWTGLRLQRGPNATLLNAFSTVVDIPYVAAQTTYAYDDTAGAVSDWYRVARYGPGITSAYSPAWPATPSATSTAPPARRSLRNLRRMLARRLGSLQVAITTADGNTAGTSFQAATLANQLDAQRYRGWWVMPTDGVSAGDVRSLGENALNPLTGQVTVNPAFTSQIYRGTELELHKLLPPAESGGLLGLREALNLALAECWTIDRVPLAGLAGTSTYSLGEIGDWLDPGAIHEVYGPAIGGLTPAPWGPFVARTDAAVAALDLYGLGVGTNVDLELSRPGDTYIKVEGATWTDGQAGFVNDTDECLFQPAFLVEIGLVYALEALAGTAIGPEQTRWSAMAAAQRTRANILKWRSLPHPPDRIAPYTPGYGDDWLRSIK